MTVTDKSAKIMVYIKFRATSPVLHADIFYSPHVPVMFMGDISVFVLMVKYWLQLAINSLPSNTYMFIDTYEFQRAIYYCNDGIHLILTLELISISKCFGFLFSKNSIHPMPCNFHTKLINLYGLCSGINEFLPVCAKLNNSKLVRPGYKLSLLWRIFIEFYFYNID